MEKQLITLLESYNKLIDSNAKLISTVNIALEETVKTTKEKETLLAHCGTIYDLLESKSNKTEAEYECVKLLYQLITHAKNIA